MIIGLGHLAESVAHALANRRIGRPVALRLHAYVAGDADDLLPCAAGLLQLIGPWFMGSLERIDVRGRAAAGGDVTVLAEFSQSETALVSSHLLHGTSPRIDFYLLGTQGTLHHDGSGNADHELLSHRALPTPEESLLAALQQSLASGEPIDL